MRKFEFRLAKVLEYRRMVEDWAKQDYIAAQSKLLEGEDIEKSMRLQILTTLQQDPTTLEERISLEGYLQRLESDLEMHRSILDILQQDVENTHHTYILKRQEAEAIQKLHDQELEEYQLDANRAEQAELDEFANNRREAA